MAGDDLGLYDITEALTLGAAGDDKLLGHQLTADHTAEVGYFGVIAVSESIKDRLKIGCQADKLAYNIPIGAAENRYYSSKTDDTIGVWYGNYEVLFRTIYGARAGVEILEVVDRGLELGYHIIDKVYLVEEEEACGDSERDNNMLYISLLININIDGSVQTIMTRYINKDIAREDQQISALVLSLGGISASSADNNRAIELIIDIFIVKWSAFIISSKSPLCRLANYIDYDRRGSEDIFIEYRNEILAVGCNNIGLCYTFIIQNGY